MTKPLYIGVDLGTTRIKIGIFDTGGCLVAVTVRECLLENPKPGFAEFDAEAYMSLAFDGIRELLAHPEVDASSVRGVGLASQAQTFVLLDEHQRPIRPAISWLDVRAKEEAREFNDVSLRVCGLKADAIASGPKLLWLARHEPDLMTRARQVLLLPDFFIFLLTGHCVSDIRTAESTALYDRQSGHWIKPLLDLCGLKKNMMPQVRYPGESAGTLCSRMAVELGLPNQTIAAVGANDQLAGALGVGNVVPGYGSIALGTALAIIVTSDKEHTEADGICLRPHPVRGLYALLAYSKTAGIVIRWFRDIFAPSLDYNDLFEEVASVPVGCNGVTCLPHFLGTATPTFNPLTRGVFSGLELSHSRAHLARAIIESLTFTIRENLDLLSRAVGEVKVLRATGGGAESNVWLQMIADATGFAIEKPATREAACFGAAQLAMVADGSYSSISEASTAFYRIERKFEPDASLRAVYHDAFEKYRNLSTSFS